MGFKLTAISKNNGLLIDFVEPSGSVQSHYAPKEAQDITTAEIEAYLVYLIREKDIAPSTQNQLPLPLS